MRKFFASIFGIILIFVFWSLNFNFSIIDTFFKKSFYDETFKETVYQETKKIIVYDYIRQNFELAADINDEDLHEVVDENFKRGDLDQVIDQLLDGLINYKESDNIVVSLTSLKLSFKNIINELLQEYYGESEYDYMIEDQDFYQYLPSEFTVNNYLNPQVLKVINSLFINNILIQLIFICIFLIALIIFYFIVDKNNLNRLYNTSLFIIVLSLINLLWTFLFFKFLQFKLVQDFPVESVNNKNFDLFSNIYNIFFDPLYHKMILQLIILLIIAALTMIMVKFKMKDSK